MGTADSMHACTIACMRLILGVFDQSKLLDALHACVHMWLKRVYVVCLLSLLLLCSRLVVRFKGKKTQCNAIEPAWPYISASLNPATCVSHSYLDPHLSCPSTFTIALAQAAMCCCFAFVTVLAAPLISLTILLQF